MGSLVFAFSQGFTIVLIVILVLLVFAGIWFIATLNSLRKMEVKVDESLSGIDVALTKRYDMLTKMLDTTKGFAKHETETLLAVIEARKGSISNLSLESKEDFSNDLNKVSSGIIALAEQYPDLKSNTVFMNLQRSIADVEDHLQAARRLYNNNVSLLNQALVTFPKSLVASWRHINKRAFFEAEEIRREDISMEF